MAPFRYAYSFVLISRLQHLLRNSLIPCTSTIETPNALHSDGFSVLSGPLVRILCNMLSSGVSVVSKEMLSCAIPRTSSGAQLLLTRTCWSSTGSSRKQGTFFTNLRVFTSTADAALQVVCGDRSTTFFFDPQEQACTDTATLGILCWEFWADCMSFFRILYRMLLCLLSLMQWHPSKQAMPPGVLRNSRIRISCAHFCAPLIPWTQRVYISFLPFKWQVVETF